MWPSKTTAVASRIPCQVPEDTIAEGKILSLTSSYPTVKWKIERVDII
jgi:hypothetical protein